MSSKNPAEVNVQQHDQQTRKSTVNLRVGKIRPLIPPAILLEELPVSQEIEATVRKGREEITAVFSNTDDRLLVVVGPCSIHDTKAAIEYAARLRSVVDDYHDDLVIVMRVYFEKPRTTVGWKGLINDPDLNGTFNINKGLRVSRQLLLDINEMGLPVATEFLDTITPQYIADTVSWGAIGARTTESQLHRQLTSGLSMPVGFKNGTGGSIQIAVDAIVSASSPHCFLGVTEQGLAGIINTTGNKECHLILRGSERGPNYHPEDVENSISMLQKAKVSTKIMIDCSHGNSRKLHTNQKLVADSVAEQVESGNNNILGVMIESNLVEGNQKITQDLSKLEYGKSVTDACINFDTTLELLDTLAKSVRARRQRRNEI